MEEFQLFRAPMDLRVDTRQRSVLVRTSLASFMAALDAMVVTTALTTTLRLASWQRCAMALAMAATPWAWADGNPSDAGGFVLEPGWLSGSVRGAYWSGSRKLDDERDLAAASLWLKAEAHTGDVSSVAQGWVMNDELDRHAPARTLLREAYLQYSRGPMTVRLGRQLIVWGRADQVNPTDNLTPRDYTLLVPDVGDERFGTLALQASRRFGDYTISGLWLPRFRPHVVPLAAEFAVTEVLPSSARQWGLKLDHSASSGIDWSASWYSGFDLSPSLRPNQQAPGTIDATHPRIQVAGVDFAVPIGGLGLRGEAAYTWTAKGWQTEPLAKKPFFFGVLGVERTFGGTLNVNLQAYSYRVTGFSDPRELRDPVLRALAVAQAVGAHQIDQWEHGLTLRIADKWWNEALEGEVVLVSSLGRKSHAVRPRVTYAFDDHVRMTVGADVFRGSGETSFGQLRANSAALAELRFSW